MEKMRFNLNRPEKDALDQMVKIGLFNNRDEAARAAIVKYAMDIGVLNRQAIWRKMEGVRRRKVFPGQLARDLEILEDED